MSRFNARLLRCDGVDSLRREMQRVGADPRGITIMAPKGRLHIVKVERLGFAAASILKQEMLAKGGEAVLSGDIYFGGEYTTDALLIGNSRTYRQVLAVLRIQPLASLQQLGAELETALQHDRALLSPALQIGGREFTWGQRTYIMGILNITPDSFSGDGALRSGVPPEQAVAQSVVHGLDLLAQGADILDVGGESTRPGSQPLDATVERERVLPVIRALRSATSAPISVDTYKASVARAALDAGADMVNDVWGLQMDPQMAELVAETRAPIVIMHNRSRPKDATQEERLGGHYVGVQYDDLMADILRELRQQVESALSAGIAPERIIVDAGIGFGKTVEQNLWLLNHLDELRVLGLPILVGTSRKSFIGHTLDLPPEQRAEGTAATVGLAIVRGAHIVRVHDVGAMSRVAHMMDALLKAPYP